MDGVSNPSIPEVSIAAVPADAVLLDVREADEWAAGHAPGAVHVPMTELAGRLSDVPEGDPVYVICRSGGRSARVTAYLNQQGWDSVNVAGGMGGWAAAGRPMEADSGGAPEVI
jgi:rhodanese-related sulfurtransferase